MEVVYCEGSVLRDGGNFDRDGGVFYRRELRGMSYGISSITS